MKDWTVVIVKAPVPSRGISAYNICFQRLPDATLTKVGSCFLLHPVFILFDIFKKSKILCPQMSITREGGGEEEGRERARGRLSSQICLL